MLPLIVALNVAGAVSFEDRTEARARVVTGPVTNPADPSGRTLVNEPAPTPENPAATKVKQSKAAAVVDIETNPTGRVRFASTNDRFVLTLAYAPRVVFGNLTSAGSDQRGGTENQPGATIDLIHRPMLTLESRLSPRDIFAVNSLVQFGSTTAGTLLQPERWDGEQRPNVPRAFPVRPFVKQTFLSIYAAAGMTHVFSPRLFASLSAFYITFGSPTHAGRIENGQATYLQNPGVNLEVDYAVAPTANLVFNFVPQVNVVKAAPIAEDGNGNQLATDGAAYFGPDGLARPGATARYLDRTVPSTYQFLFEARLRKQVARMTGYELAVGANLLQQTLQVATVQVPRTNPDGTPVLDPAGQPLVDPVDVLDPFKFRSNTAGSATNLATSVRNDTRLNALPVAEVLISHGFATAKAQGKLIAFSRADAWLNTASGEIGARSTNVAALSFDFGLDAVRAQGSFVQSLPLSEQTTFYRQILGEVAYSRKMTPEWVFDVGARVGMQEAFITNTFSSLVFQPGAFAGIAYRPLPAKF